MVLDVSIITSYIPKLGTTIDLLTQITKRFLKALLHLDNEMLTNAQIYGIVLKDVWRY